MVCQAALSHVWSHSIHCCWSSQNSPRSHQNGWFSCCQVFGRSQKAAFLNVTFFQLYFSFICRKFPPLVWLAVSTENRSSGFSKKRSKTKVQRGFEGLCHSLFRTAFRKTQCTSSCLAGNTGRYSSMITVLTAIMEPGITRTFASCSFSLKEFKPKSAREWRSLRSATKWLSANRSFERWSKSTPAKRLSGVLTTSTKKLKNISAKRKTFYRLVVKYSMEAVYLTTSTEWQLITFRWFGELCRKNSSNNTSTSKTWSNGAIREPWFRLNSQLRTSCSSSPRLLDLTRFVLLCTMLLFLRLSFHAQCRYHPNITQYYIIIRFVKSLFYTVIVIKLNCLFMIISRSFFLSLIGSSPKIHGVPDHPRTCRSAPSHQKSIHDLKNSNSVNLPESNLLERCNVVKL